MKEITIAYGKEIQLTTDKKTQKQVFVKISTAFREKQLKELKGAPLSVFLCYALHSDTEGYTWIDNKLIEKETGYKDETITKAKKILIKEKYLYTSRLINKEKKFKDWVYRLFQSVEEKKQFFIRKEALFPNHGFSDGGVRLEVGSKQGYNIKRAIIKKEELLIYTTYGKFINSHSRLTDSSKEKIKTRLKTFTVKELIQAIENFSQDSWWMKNNSHRGIAWFFHNDDRIDQFLNLESKKDPLLYTSKK